MKRKGKKVKKAQLTTNEMIDFNGLTDPILYREFIFKMADYCDTFLLATYVDEHSHNITNIDDFKKSRWGFLAAGIVDYEYTDVTPVTQGPKMMLIYFKMTRQSYDYLTKRKNIYDFRDYEHPGKHQYNWLWDLAFIKDETVFFCSCTHEKFCFLDLEAYRRLYG